MKGNESLSNHCLKHDRRRYHNVCHLWITIINVVFFNINKLRKDVILVEVLCHLDHEDIVITQFYDKTVPFVVLPIIFVNYIRLPVPNWPHVGIEIVGISKLRAYTCALKTEVIMVLLNRIFNASDGDFTIILWQNIAINGVSCICVSKCACTVSFQTFEIFRSTAFRILYPWLHLTEADILSLSGQYFSQKKLLLRQRHSHLAWKSSC